MNNSDKLAAKSPERVDSDANPVTLAPGDLDQSLVRIVIVGVVLIGTVYARFRVTDAVNVETVNNLLAMTVAYFVASLAIHVWSMRVHQPGHRTEVLVRRCVVSMTDVLAATAYMVVAGSHGGFMYTVYLWNIIGNGIRYGTGFLYFSMALCVVGFATAVWLADFWKAFPELTLGLFVALLVIPLYVLRLLKTLNQTLVDLRQSHAARARFIANMSHELRTPLHTILSLGDLLQHKSRQRVDDKEDEALRMVTSSAEHLLTLVNQVLDVARYESGKTRSESTPFELFALLQKVNDIVSAQAAVKDLDFNLFVEARVPNSLSGSAEFVSQILVNLLGNAIKFTREGRVELTISLQHADDDSVVLLFEVEDSGIGMSQTALKRIFEPFAQADDSVNRRFGGTGLGLTISRQLAELMGGSIACTSIENIGSHFVVQLPFARVAEAAPAGAQRVNAVFLSRAMPDAATVAMYAGYGWDLDFHDLDSVVPAVNAPGHRHPGRQPFHAIFVDAASWGGKAAGVAQHLRRELTHCPYLIQVGTQPGSFGGLNLPFLSQIDAGAEPETLASLARLVAALVRDSSPEALVARRRCTVLVADDNHINQRTARMVLESAGHTVVVVDDGEKALDALEQGIYDIAFMDMHMPNMDGVQAAKLYNVMQPGTPTPIVMLTADITPEARHSAEAAYIAAFLTKPIRAHEMLRVIDTYARKTPAARPAETTVYPLESARERAYPEQAPRRVPKNVVSLSEALVDPRELEQLLSYNTDPGEVYDLVEEFIADARTQLKEARKFYDYGKWMAGRDVMHALKGAAATMGAVALAKRAGALEAAPPSELEKRGIQELDDLKGLLERTQNELRSVLRDNTGQRPAQNDRS